MCTEGTMTLSSLSNFITIRLDRTKASTTCNSLDRVTCFPLYFTLACIVYIENHGPVKLFTYIMAFMVKCILESTVI